MTRRDATERAERMRFEEFTGVTALQAVLLVIPALLVIAASIWAAVHFLEPMPPRKVVLAAGPEGAVLHALARQYAERIRKEGIDVEVRVTRGAEDNLEQIAGPEPRADLAFVFAGTASPEQAKRLVNIATLMHVPLWGFTRSEVPESTIAELRGKRLAVGAPGTGLAAMLAPLLAANGVSEANSTLVHLPTKDAVARLANGELDAIFIAEGLRSPGFEAAVGLPGLQLMSFVRAEAYARLHSHLVHLTLPRGTLDLARDRPERDLSLVGTSLMIVGRSNIHPTVVDLVVDASEDLHGLKTVFDKRGEFPHIDQVDDIPVSDQARLYARNGPSLLRRYLPLWAADAIQRIIVLAIPLVAVMVPLVRVLPALLDLLARRHVYRGYAALRRLERKLRARAPGQPVDDLLEELMGIEDSIAGVKESITKAGELYTLRVHLRVVRDAVLARMQGADASTSREAVAR